MGLFDFVGDFFETVFSWFIDIPEEKGRQLQLNKRSNVEPVPVIYGLRKVGGTIVFKTNGDKPSGNNKKNAYLYMAIVLCEGEVESVTDLWINDKHINEYPSKDIRRWDALAPTDPETDVVIHKYYGTEDQPASPLLLESPDWSVDHRLRGLVYLACRFKFNPEIFGGGDPKINCVVKGKKVYDPRNGVTNWRENGALCLLDYLTNSRYGKGLPLSSIDLPSFIQAANDCDNTVAATDQFNYGSPSSVFEIGELKYMLFFTKPAEATILPGMTLTDDPVAPTKVGKVVSGFTSPGYFFNLRNYTLQYDMVSGDDFTPADTIYAEGDTHLLYACNAVVDTGQKIFDNVKMMLAGIRGIMPYRQGLYALEVEQDRAPVFHFTEDHIIGGVSVQLPQKSDKYNKVTVEFANPNTNWEDDLAIFPVPGSQEETDFLAEDGGTPLHKKIRLETVNNKYQAADLARLICYKSRANIRCNFRTTSEALARTVGEVIELSDTTRGWTGKLFMIVQLGLNEDGTVSLECAEHTPGIYDYNGIPVDITDDDTDLPDPLSIGPPSNLVATSFYDARAVGIGQAGINLTWDGVDDSTLDFYEVNYRSLILSSEWSRVTAFGTEIDLVPLLWLATYELRVRAVNRLGLVSQWSPVLEHYILLDTTPPDPPTSVSATPGSSVITVAWVNPTDIDLQGTRSYISLTDTFPGAGNFATEQSQATNNTNITGLQPSTDYYVWVSSIDDAGNESAPVAATPFPVTTLVGNVDDGNEQDVGGKKTFLDGICVGDGTFERPSHAEFAEFTKLKWAPPSIAGVQTPEGFLEFANYINERATFIMAPTTDVPLGVSYLFLTGTFNGPDDPFMSAGNDVGWSITNQLYTDPDDNNIVVNSHMKQYALTWGGRWAPVYYPVNTMVYDSGWTMVVVNPAGTSERAAPQPVGDPEAGLPDEPAFTTQSTAATVLARHDYAITSDGWLTGVRVWVPSVGASITHRLITIVDPFGTPEVRITPLTGLAPNGWNTVAIGQAVVTAGTEVSLLLETRDTSASTQVSGPWRYDGSSQNEAPGAGGWNTNNTRALLRIDKTDTNSADRAAALLGIVSGSVIRFEETGVPTRFVEFLVLENPTDAGSYIEFGEVAVSASVGTIGVGVGSDMVATVPTPSPAEYAELPSYWSASGPTWATVTASLDFDGVAQPGVSDNAYGVDVAFQAATVSADWELVSYGGDVAGGGGIEEPPADGKTYMRTFRDGFYQWIACTCTEPPPPPGAFFESVIEPDNGNTNTSNIGYETQYDGHGSASVVQIPSKNWEFRRYLEFTDDLNPGTFAFGISFRDMTTSPPPPIPDNDTSWTFVEIERVTPGGEYNQSFFRTQLPNVSTAGASPAQEATGWIARAFAGGTSLNPTLQYRVRFFDLPYDEFTLASATVGQVTGYVRDVQGTLTPDVTGAGVQVYGIWYDAGDSTWNFALVDPSQALEFSYFGALLSKTGSTPGDLYPFNEVSQKPDAAVFTRGNDGTHQYTQWKWSITAGPPPASLAVSVHGGPTT